MITKLEQPRDSNTLTMIAYIIVVLSLVVQHPHSCISSSEKIFVYDLPPGDGSVIDLSIGDFRPLPGCWTPLEACTEPSGPFLVLLM
jgi:hypothetical protein